MKELIKTIHEYPDEAFALAVFIITIVWIIAKSVGKRNIDE